MAKENEENDGLKKGTESDKDKDPDHDQDSHNDADNDKQSSGVNLEGKSESKAGLTSGEKGKSEDPDIDEINEPVIDSESASASSSS